MAQQIPANLIHPMWRNPLQFFFLKKHTFDEFHLKCLNISSLCWFFFFEVQNCLFIFWIFWYEQISSTHSEDSFCQCCFDRSRLLFYDNFAGIQTRIPSTPPIRDCLQREFIYDQLNAQKASTIRILLSTLLVQFVLRFEVPGETTIRLFTHWKYA